MKPVLDSEGLEGSWGLLTTCILFIFWKVIWGSELLERFGV